MGGAHDGRPLALGNNVWENWKVVKDRQARTNENLIKICDAGRRFSSKRH